MLPHQLHVPDDVAEGAAVFVLLHGRGSDERDLLSLAPHVVPGAVVVAPRAPFPAAPWGYGSGWAWYKFLGRDRPDADTLTTSLGEIETFLGELPNVLPVRPGPLILGGFSQGGTCSIAYALTHPGTVPMVMNFSGFLAAHPDVDVTPDNVKGTRFFWGHGTRDGNIPFDLAVEGRARLTRAGADLEAHDYPIGHWIDPGELRDAMNWVSAAS